MDILHEIAEKTRQRIEAEKKELPPEEIRKRRTQLNYYAEYTSAGIISLLTYWISTREIRLPSRSVK